MPENNENVNPISNTNSAIEDEQLSNHMDPDGICCFEKCLTIGHKESVDKKIFFGSPTCAGMVRVTCNNSLCPCILNFHKKCWNAKKELCWPDRKMSEKEICQSEICFTPSCIDDDGSSSLIDKIEILDANGKLYTKKQREIITTKPVKMPTSKETAKKPIPQKLPKPKTSNKTRPLAASNSQTIPNEAPKVVKNENSESAPSREILNSNKQKLINLRMKNFGIAEDNKWTPKLPMYGNDFMVATANVSQTPDFSKDSTEVAKAKTLWFEHFYELISKYGPMELKELTRRWLELKESSDIEIYDQVLTRHTSIGEFLVQSLNLAIINDYICTMDQLPLAYNIAKERALLFQQDYDIPVSEEKDDGCLFATENYNTSTIVNETSLHKNVGDSFKQKREDENILESGRNKKMDEEKSTQEAATDNTSDRCKVLPTSNHIDNRNNPFGDLTLENVRAFAQFVDKELESSKKTTSLKMTSSNDLVSSSQSTPKKTIKHNNEDSAISLRKHSLNIDTEKNGNISKPTPLFSGTINNMDKDPNDEINNLKMELARVKDEVHFARFELAEIKKMNTATKGRLLKKVLCSQHTFSKHMISTKMKEIQNDYEQIAFIQEQIKKLTGQSLPISESILQQNVEKIKQIAESHEEKFLQIENQLLESIQMGNPREVDLLPELIPELPKYVLMDVIRSAFDIIKLQRVEENASQPSTPQRSQPSQNSGHYQMNPKYNNQQKFHTPLSTNFRPPVPNSHGYNGPQPLFFPLPNLPVNQQYYHGPRPHQRFQNPMANLLGAPLMPHLSAPRPDLSNIQLPQQPIKPLMNFSKNSPSKPNIMKPNDALSFVPENVHQVTSQHVKNNVHQFDNETPSIEKLAINREHHSSPSHGSKNAQIITQSGNEKLQKPKGQSLDRLMQKMRSRYTGVLELDLLKSIICVRKQHNNSLSSMTMKQIIYEAHKFISRLQREQLCSYTQYKSYVPQPFNMGRNQTVRPSHEFESKPQSLTASTSSLFSTASSSSSKKHVPMETTVPKKCWLTVNAPNEKWDNEKARDCSICYEEVANEEVHSLPCKHSYHKKCIEKWYRSNANESVFGSCPECRHPFIDDHDYPPLLQN